MILSYCERFPYYSIKKIFEYRLFSFLYKYDFVLLVQEIDSKSQIKVLSHQNFSSNMFPENFLKCKGPNKIHLPWHVNDNMGSSM